MEGIALIEYEDKGGENHMEIEKRLYGSRQRFKTRE